MSSIAETYSRMSDDEIVRLHGEMDTLLDEGNAALRAEINKRGLTDESMSAQREEWARVQREEAAEKRKRRFITLTKFAIVIAVGILFSFAADFIGLFSTDGAAGGLFGSLLLLNLTGVFISSRAVGSGAGGYKASKWGDVVTTLAIIAAVNLALLIFLLVKRAI